MTSIKIINGKFHINDIPANAGNDLRQGKLLGICTDLCTFHADKNINNFLIHLKSLQNSDINIISAGFQSPNPFREYYKKSRERDKLQDKLMNLTHLSSALKPDGTLDYHFLENLEQIIRTADSFGLAVLVNILDSSCENIFVDEFAVITGIFNAAEWLIRKKFDNILVNLSNISHTFYKSSVLNGEKFINIFKSVKAAAGNHLMLGAGMKNFAGVSKNAMDMYIKTSDFIPIYSVNYRSHSTKKMIENIYFFKAHSNVPIIMAKGDDLSDGYNSYGKNNMAEAFENNISWFYYSLDKLGLMPVEWELLQNLQISKNLEI